MSNTRITAASANSHPRPSLLLIQAGTAPDVLKDKFGDLPQWFMKATGVAPEDVQIVEIFRGETLPEPTTHCVAIITGSWDMVTDKLPWSEKAAEWIRRAVDADMPLFGVCYGHQLMAYALGGTVDFNPQGREVGCLAINLTPAGFNDPMTMHLSQGFSAHLTHLQTVTELPPGAQVLASSQHDRNQIIRYSSKAVSTQFHPEFTPEIAASLIDLRTDVLLSEGYHPAKMRAALTDAADASGILKTFINNHTATSRPERPAADDYHERG